MFNSSLLFRIFVACYTLIVTLPVCPAFLVTLNPFLLTMGDTDVASIILGVLFVPSTSICIRRAYIFCRRVYIFVVVILFCFQYDVIGLIKVYNMCLVNFEDRGNIYHRFFCRLVELFMFCFTI